MRVLVVSDIHANFAALRAVPEKFDHVLCLGDTVDYGPDPKPCIEWLQERDAIAVRGNHDAALATGQEIGCSPRMRLLAEATQRLMRVELGAFETEYLGTLPLQSEVVLGGLRFHLVHATPSSPLYPYVRPDELWRGDEELEKTACDILLVGHTHLPMVLKFGKRMVVNPGSVGQPRDGDPRAAYAVIDDGEPLLERATYDIEATAKRLAAASLPFDVTDSLTRLLRTGEPNAVWEEGRSRA
jgi:putative phosphoesterase